MSIFTRLTAKSPAHSNPHKPQTPTTAVKEKPPYDHLFKILLLGDSDVGKAAFLMRFADETFTPTFVSTVGVDFKIRTLDIDGKVVKLQIWDTAGQERFRTITSSYYRGASVVVVVFDASSSSGLENVESHMQQVRQNAKQDVVVVLAGNIPDGNKPRVISTESARAIAAKYKGVYFETNPKTNVGIEELVFHCARAAMAQAAGNASKLPAQPSSAPPSSAHSMPPELSPMTSMAKKNFSKQKATRNPPTPVRTAVDEEKLKACLRDGFAKCRYLKVVLGGEGRAGKSSTKRSLLGYDFDPSTHATNGIDITKAVLSEKSFQEQTHLDVVKQGILDALSKQQTQPQQPGPNTPNTQHQTEPTSPPPPSYPQTTTKPKQSIEEDGTETVVSSTVVADTSDVVLLEQDLSEVQPALEDSIPSFLGKLQLDDDIQQAFDGAKQEDSVTALFYDCGGQNIYQTANELFFTPRSIVLLVFDMQATLQTGNISVLKGWCNNISLHAPNSPIVLVGTHADKVNNQKDHQGLSDLIRTQLSKAYAWEHVVNKDDPVVFVPLDNTNPHSDTGVVALRRLILKVARAQPFFQEEFPVRWLQCLDSIMACEEPILSIGQFQKQLAEPCGIKDEAEISALLEQFHQLGFVAHYPDPKLSQFVITKPQFIIDAISSIITSKHRLSLVRVSNQQLRDDYIERGELDKRLLVELLEGASVKSKNSQHVVTCLLQKFDLVCELYDESLEEQDSDNNLVQFLVPSMLPEKADDTSISPPNNTARLFLADQSKQSVFPLGVYYRLVCKCLRWSQLTSSLSRTMTLKSAVLAFGRQVIKITAHDDDTPHIKVIIGSEHAAPVLDLIEMLLREVCNEAFPHLSTTVQVEVKMNDKIFVRDISDVRASIRNLKPLLAKHGNTVVELPHSLFSPWVNPTLQSPHFHLFLSYRVASDTARAKLLFDCLTMQSVSDNGTAPSVFLDSKCLLVGHQWDLAFALALKSSTVFVAVVSEGSMEIMVERARMYCEVACEDNVLLEWQLAIELERRGIVQAVVPLLASKDLLGTLVLPPVVNHLTNARCVDFLGQLGVELTPEDKTRLLNQTCADVAKAMSRFQALQLDHFANTRKGSSDMLTTDWNKHMKCAVKLIQIVRQEIAQQQQATATATTAPTTPATKTTDKADRDCRAWLDEHGFGHIYDALKERHCHLMPALLMLTVPQIQVLLTQVGITDELQSERFKSQLQQAKLRESIDSWLTQLKMENFIDAFREQRCDTFEVLLNAQEMGALDVLLEALKVEGWQKSMFVGALNKQRVRILGE